MVAMLPSADKQGALEHLFLPVACEASGKISNCFSELMKCCGAEVWGEIKQAKMQLRMLISAQWRDDPNISLSFLWQKDKCKDLIPITHKSFDPLAEFFKEFDIGRKNNEAKS